jgi:hypothetical protein
VDGLFFDSIDEAEVSWRGGKGGVRGCESNKW